MAFISCTMFPGVSCCGSCHEDAEMGYHEEMIGVYEGDFIPNGDSMKFVGSLCCTTSTAWDALTDDQKLTLYRS